MVKSDMTDQQLRRWVIDLVMTRRGMYNKPIEEAVKEADEVLGWINK